MDSHMVKIGQLTSVISSRSQVLKNLQPTSSCRLMVNPQLVSPVDIQTEIKLEVGEELVILQDIIQLCRRRSDIAQIRHMNISYLNNEPTYIKMSVQTHLLCYLLEIHTQTNLSSDIHSHKPTNIGREIKSDNQRELQIATHIQLGHENYTVLQRITILSIRTKRDQTSSATSKLLNKLQASAIPPLLIKEAGEEACSVGTNQQVQYFDKDLRHNPNKYHQEQEEQSNQLDCDVVQPGGGLLGGPALSSHATFAIHQQHNPIGHISSVLGVAQQPSHSICQTTPRQFSINHESNVHETPDARCLQQEIIELDGGDNISSCQFSVFHETSNKKRLRIQPDSHLDACEHQQGPSNDATSLQTDATDGKGGDKKNVNQNVIKSFRNYLKQPSVWKEIAEYLNISPEQVQNLSEKIIELEKKTNYNNAFIKRILSRSSQFRHAFGYYLQGPANDWLQNSGVIDKETHKKSLTKFLKYYQDPEIMEREFINLPPNK